jgi:expansin (peptidoglycan-binding protein)
MLVTSIGIFGLLAGSLIRGAPIARAASSGPIDIGITVMTVTVDSITKGNNGGDVLGPYYKMNYDFTTPTAVPATPEKKALFGAGNGQSGCGPDGFCGWHMSYSFASNGVTAVRLTLVDDQSCFLICDGHQDPVNTAGTDSFIYVSASSAANGCNVVSNNSPGALVLTKVASSDACSSYTFSGSGTSTSSVPRTASVTGTVAIRSGLQNQTWLRQRMYQTNLDMIDSFYTNGTTCYQTWRHDASVMQGEIEPLIDIGFGFGDISKGAAESIVEGVGFAQVADVVPFFGALYRLSEVARSQAIGFNPWYYLNCGNYTLMWKSYGYPNGGSTLRTDLAILAGSLPQLQTDLAGTSRASAATDLSSENIKGAIQDTQALINYLTGSGPTGDLCFNGFSPISCGPYAVSLANGVFVPLLNFLQQDAAYATATSNLLTSLPAGNTPPPTTYSYAGVYNGQTSALTWHTNVTVEGLPDQTLVGSISNFQTNDPQYSCLNGQAINLWTAPAEFPGVLVVHDGWQGPMCVWGTWTFPQTYTGAWLGSASSLSLHSSMSVSGYSDATTVGTVSNFQTNNPTYSCLNGTSLTVRAAPKELPGIYVVYNSTQCAAGSWVLQRTYTGSWSGTTTPLSWHTGVTVEGYADAKVVGQAANFQTNDPTYSCLNGKAINVFTAPKEFPGLYVVHDGLQGSMCVYGTWTFPQIYSGNWQGHGIAVTPQANTSVEGYSDAQLIGPLKNFRTNDPTYSCLNGQTINLFVAPREFPGAYVVHDGLQGSMCVYGTWTFPENYSGTWSGNRVVFSLVYPNKTVESYADAKVVGQITNFETDDPQYQCLNRQTINVFTAPKEFPGVYVVHDGLQGSMCVYGTWSFPQ